jgi:hypothetical protein
MVGVDRLAKYAHFCALSHPFSTSTVAATFMGIVQKLHGNSKIIVSDRDLIFMGKIWIELFSCFGTQLAHSSSYHPQSDGKTKIVNKCLEGYLCCFASDKQTRGEMVIFGKMVVQYFLPYDIKNVPIYGTLWVPSTIYHITLERPL